MADIGYNITSGPRNPFKRLANVIAGSLLVGAAALVLSAVTWAVVTIWRSILGAC